MKYITGIHALNLPCALETTGDWHASALDWDDVPLKESGNSVFKDYGIERDQKIFCLDYQAFNKADHIRAVLDSLENGDFFMVQGFRKDFFCVKIDTEAFFLKVLLLKDNPLWNDIVKAMSREYKSLWVNFLRRRKIMHIYNKDKEHDLKQSPAWQENHKKVMFSFLEELNKGRNKESFILKGGTALLFCYGLARFSEDIDLDAISSKANIERDLQAFCKEHGYSFSVKKDTDTTKRYMINYGDARTPLKVEISYRDANDIELEDMCRINGINVYTINELLQMKTAAFQARDRIRDLFDVVFLYNNYKDQLEKTSIKLLKGALRYKGIEQFDYLVNTNNDPFFKNDKLVEDFLYMWDDIGMNPNREKKSSSQYNKDIDLDNLDDFALLDILLDDLKYENETIESIDIEKLYFLNSLESAFMQIALKYCTDIDEETINEYILNNYKKIREVSCELEKAREGY